MSCVFLNHVSTFDLPCYQLRFVLSGTPVVTGCQAVTASTGYSLTCAIFLKYVSTIRFLEYLRPELFQRSCSFRIPETGRVLPLLVWFELCWCVCASYFIVLYVPKAADPYEVVGGFLLL